MGCRMISRPLGPCFFFSSRRRHTRCSRDWSSDVCSSDLLTRANALINGQVDVIETPPPDALDQLKKGGFKVVSNVTPHVWPYHFSTYPGSPRSEERRVGKECRSRWSPYH